MRQAWHDVTHALGQKRPPADIAARLNAARDVILSAVTSLQALVTVCPTAERESLLGSAHKRLHQLEVAAGRSAAARAAAQQMAAHYQRAGPGPGSRQRRLVLPGAQWPGGRTAGPCGHTGVAGL